MKNLEAIVEEIVKQRKIDALMKLKREKREEITAINIELRKLVSVKSRR